VAHLDQALDPALELRSPSRRQLPPVIDGRGASLREGRERLLDGRQRNAGLLRHPDDRDPPQYAARIAALIASRPRAADQPLGLVEMQGRDRDAAALRGFPDAEPEIEIQLSAGHRDPLDLKYG